MYKDIIEYSEMHTRSAKIQFIDGKIKTNVIYLYRVLEAIVYTMSLTNKYEAHLPESYHEKLYNKRARRWRN